MYILLIARHYPPEVSGGARRPFLLTQALRGLGHKVTIVTPFLQENDADSIHVPHPANLTVSHQSQTETPPIQGAKIKDFARQWLLWPDPEIRWCKRAKKTILDLGVKPDWIMTTNPPESSHVIGASLAKTLKVPWLAEFRDTWVTNAHRKILNASAIRKFGEKRIAKKCLKHVSACTAVSSLVMNEISTYLPLHTPECIIGHFSTPPQSIMSLDPETINLVHTGAFTLSDRNRHIKPLLDAFEKASKVRSNLHLHLAGKLSFDEVTAIENVKNFQITRYGELSLEQSRGLQAGSDGLILLTPPASHALPGKYAEYCFAKRPILFFGGGDWLRLVDDPNSLYPLDTGLLELQKGQSETRCASLHAKEAARHLVDFLEQVII